MQPRPISALRCLLVRAFLGFRGATIGSVMACQGVEILNVAWSETDQLFWVQVRRRNVEGWLLADFISF